MEKKYKVIIVGAGPSGLSAAINLKKLGVSDVLVVERSAFPRYKCCAGYITGKTKLAYEKLGLDIGECNYSLIKDFKICYKHKQKIQINNKFLYTNEKIDRTELDYAFFRLAKKNGVEVRENTKISGHNVKSNTLTLTDGSVLNYEHLIFADGTTGFGSRYQKCKRKNIAMQLIIESEREEAIDIHFGITKRGYGWVSSYGGITNIGLTDVYNKRVNYRQVFSSFMESVGIDCGLSELKAAFTPIGVGKAVIENNIYFVGDAVGACDPLTLSGLRYGLDSGVLCAKAIAENKNKIYIRYIKKLKRKFGFMRFVQKVFYFPPVRFIVFCIMCRIFGRTVSYAFNNIFVNKK